MSQSDHRGTYDTLERLGEAREDGRPGDGLESTQISAASDVRQRESEVSKGEEHGSEQERWYDISDQDHAAD